MSKIPSVLRTAALAASLGTALGAGGASACDVMHSLQHETDGGWYLLSINGAQLDHGAGTSSGARPLQDWLVTGPNVVTADFRGDAGVMSGRFSILKSCRGEMPDETPVDSVTLDGSGVAELVFTHGGAVEAEYTKAEVAGDKGLMEAVTALQDAVRAGDIDKVMAMHAPMLREFARQGAPIDRVEEHMREMLAAEGPLLAQKLIAKPILGGRVYQVLDADWAPPVHIDIEANGGTLSWSTGTYWGRFDGEWAIVAR